MGIILPATEGNCFFLAVFKIFFGLMIFELFTFTLSLSTTPRRNFVVFTLSSHSPLLVGLSLCLSLFYVGHVWEGNQEDPRLHSPRELWD